MSGSQCARLYEMKTTFPSLRASECEWLLIDAAGKTLGRLCSRIALLLRGKHRVSWSPHTEVGAYVVVINAASVAVTGKKEKNKVYYRHTGYPGGIKSTKLADLRATHPERIMRNAVRGMLPKGPLGRRMLAKLKVYAGVDHDHTAQVPQPYDWASEVL